MGLKIACGISEGILKIGRKLVRGLAKRFFGNYNGIIIRRGSW